MQSCLPENTELLIKDSAGEVSRVTLAYFDAMLDDEQGGPALSRVRVLGRRGWVEFISISRRRLWEGEELLCVRTRSGQIATTCDHRIAVKRGLEDIVVPARDLGTGDALMVFEQPALGKSARPIGEDPVFRPFGVLSVIRTVGYDGSVYQVETADHTLVANDFLMHTV
ncbi:MAG TPA: Hint domain-containing protein [Bacillota bacterium]|jgi:intein/homing endonuclease|nr:Hint domain-containing protein [Bacillota bacterium]